MGAADAIHARFSDTFVPSHELGELDARLSDPGAGTVAGVIAALAENPKASELQARRAAIDALFARPTVEAIFEGLAASSTEWVHKAHAALREKSPKSLKLTLAAIRNARNLGSLEDALKIEYRLCVRLFEDGEFPEGVRALIIDRDRSPKWSPSTLAEVTPEMVAHYLAPLPAAEELRFEETQA
jgi:enoyl-CoA hydratase